MAGITTNSLRAWRLMRFLGTTWILLMVGLNLSAQPAGPAPRSPRKLRPDETDAFFASEQISRLQIQLSPSALNSLRRDPRTYVRGTVREGDMTYENVGIHLKGAAGSFRPIDDQPALTLNFDKFKEDQRFHGLDKLHLNNSLQDPSFLTELICSELFLAAGVPAARTTHAVVELNGRKLGLYVVKEGFTKSFLKRHFANPKGNLYDGGFLKDITEPMERISGTEDGQPAVERLVKACRINDPNLRLTELEKRLDVERFISFLVVEMMTWHWDGYLMKANNYRLYHDPETDRIVFLPHGMDQMFWQPGGTIFPTSEGMVASRLLSATGIRTRYRTRAAELTTNVFQADRLTERIRLVAKRIRPALAETDPHGGKSHDVAVKTLIRQITQRAAYLNRVLIEAEVKPLAFDAQGEAPLGKWRSRLDSGGAQFRQTEQAGRPVLIVEAASTDTSEPRAEPEPCLASYRIQVLLEPGHYRFLGRIKTEEVVPASVSVRGSGAGLRISGRPRQEGLVGSVDWRELRYDFRVKEAEEIELICDLRAQSGRALFEAGSLKLKRLTESDAGPKEK